MFYFTVCKVTLQTRKLCISIMYFVAVYIDFSEMETMHNARNKDQELVGRFEHRIFL